MVTEATIRQAIVTDIPMVVTMGMKFLSNGPYKDQIGNPKKATQLAFAMLQSTGGQIIILEEEGKVVGMFAFIVTPHYFSGELTAQELIWYVEPESRKGGAALKLLAEAERISRSLGVKRMQLTAPTEELGKLYKYCGGYTRLEVTYQRVL